MSASGTGNSGPSSLVPQLAAHQFKRGQSGNRNGRPKGLISLKRRFREAFAEAPPNGEESLVNVVMALARGKVVKMERVDEDGQPRFEYAYVESKQQMEAIKFIAAYGFGAPTKSLDDETTQRLALQMVNEMIAKAEAAKVAKLAATDVETVEPAQSGETK